MLCKTSIGFNPGRDQVNGIPLDTSGFRFNGAPLNEYPGVTFQINIGCSPSAPNDNLAVRTLTVPALDYEGMLIAPATLPHMQHSVHFSAHFSHTDIPEGLINFSSCPYGLPLILLI